VFTVENSHLSHIFLLLILKYLSLPHFIMTFQHSRYRYFNHQSNRFLWNIYRFRKSLLSTYLKLCQLSWETGINYREREAAELPKRFSINPRGSDKCKYIGRVVVTRASFASSTEKFFVRLISVVNVRREADPHKPNEDDRAIHFITRKLTNRILFRLEFVSQSFVPLFSRFIKFHLKTLPLYIFQ